jgi:hypothetical protein
MILGAHVDTDYLLKQTSEADGSPRDRLWTAAFHLAYPLDADVPVTFTRPFYPYPAFAKYTGKGDPNDARNFQPVIPAAAHAGTD